MECAKVTTSVRKSKKKQVKDEVDRIKQAEKKKRRLEKALATSAAIRSELEKKKQKKKEEQERLDEEGAAIAESVALHVLLDEDSDMSSKLTLNKDEEPTLWDYASNIDIIVRGEQASAPYQDFSNYSPPENIGWVSAATNGYGNVWNYWGDSNVTVTSDQWNGRFYPRRFGEDGFGLSAGHLAAQAVSSLKIADETRVDAFVFNHMLRG